MSADFNPTSLAALMPYARAEVLRWRRWWLVLGGLLFTLGVFGAGLVGAAASPRDQPLLLIGIFTVIAILPGMALLANGIRMRTHHPLLLALVEPQRLHSVGYTYMQSIEGDYFDVARVELKSGASYVFGVPKQLVQNHPPHLQRASA